jgi:predicted small metal-binding protein
MPRFTCKDYGFECNYELVGNADQIIEKFGEHLSQEHGIQYSHAIVRLTLENKSSLKKISNYG